MHIGDYLKLIQPGGAGTAPLLRFQCLGFDAPRTVGRDPAPGTLVAIMGVGIEPDAILPASHLRATGSARRLAPPHTGGSGCGGSSGIGGGCGSPNAASAADMAP